LKKLSCYECLDDF